MDNNTIAVLQNLEAQPQPLKDSLGKTRLKFEEWMERSQCEVNTFEQLCETEFLQYSGMSSSFYLYIFRAVLRLNVCAASCFQTKFHQP